MSEHVTECVTGCGQPAGGYFLCRDCTGILAAELRRVPMLWRQLDIVAARQTRTSNGVGVTSASAEHPLPVNLAATEVARDLAGVLSTWARDLATRTGRPLDVATTPAHAAWLLETIAPMRTHPAADELHDELTDATARAWRAIDRAGDRAFLGPCDDCGADLYGRPHAAIVHCGQCGADYDTTDRRDWLLEQARDQLVTAAEAARALPALLGQAVTPAMIRGYAHRGRLGTRSGPYGKPRYRVGDVIDCVVTTPDTRGRSACA